MSGAVSRSLITCYITKPILSWPGKLLARSEYTKEMYNACMQCNQSVNQTMNQSINQSTNAAKRLLQGDS